MSEFKGTKGPWHFSFHGSENCWVTDSENDKAIAKITHYAKDAEQQKANFHLIASAPELLEELQRMVDEYDAEIIDKYEGTRAFESMLAVADKARLVIAKALGQ